MTPTQGPVGPGFSKDRGIAPSAPPERSAVNTLNVALYPYVPEPTWFEKAVQQAWQSVHPDVYLNFVPYDCYASDPPATLDVFAFDAIFARYFVQREYLQAFPVTDVNDFFPWALQGLTVNSEWLWAVPYLGCLNILAYKANDPGLGAPSLTVGKLQGILGNSPDTSPRPPPGQGMLVDFTGGTTDACIYLQVVMENAGQYPLDPSLPPCPSGLDGTAMRDLRTAVAIAGRKQASYIDSSGYDRLNWFLNGYGRAYVGLTENLHFFPPSIIGQYTFRPLPFASNPVTTIPLYADAMGVNRAVDPAKKGLAIELATLVASAAVTQRAFILGVDQTTNPQYLTPVRRSVLSSLAERWPVYRLIQSTLTEYYGTTAFRIGPTSRGYLDAYKGCIRDQILGPGIEIDETLFGPGYEQTPGGLWRKP